MGVPYFLVSVFVLATFFYEKYHNNVVVFSSNRSFFLTSHQLVPGQLCFTVGLNGSALHVSFWQPEWEGSGYSENVILRAVPEE